MPDSSSVNVAGIMLFTSEVLTESTRKTHKLITTAKSSTAKAIKMPEITL